LPSVTKALDSLVGALPISMARVCVVDSSGSIDKDLGFRTLVESEILIGILATSVWSSAMSVETSTESFASRSAFSGSAFNLDTSPIEALFEFVGSLIGLDNSLGISFC